MKAVGAMLKAWDHLPQTMRRDAVRPYYDALREKRASLVAKRLFDVVAGTVALVPMLPVLLVIGAWVRLDSRGPALFRQVRVTQYGREFRIFKFRTMRVSRQGEGTQVTVSGDARITRAGKYLRAKRLDELPQILNIIRGDMSFVGARPEVPKYVAHYTDEMMATLLLPAGVTSDCSLRYRDEGERLRGAQDVDEAYVRVVLPEKMRYNLQSLREFRLGGEFWVMVRTAQMVFSGKGGTEDG